MFWHNFKYTLKIIFRDRALIFWTFAFPIILGTFFFLAFSNITSSEALSIIDIAVVDNTAWQSDPVFRPAIEELSSADSEHQLFHTTYTSQASATELLESGEISAYLLLEVPFSANPADAKPASPKTSDPSVLTLPTIFAAKSDINSTILQSVIESIAEQAQVYATAAEIDPGKLAALAQADTAHLVDQSSSRLDYTVIEYFTLIAMTCLYGGLIGLIAVNQLLANMSMSGKRIAVSPTPKSCLLLSSLLASYLIQLLGLTLLFGFLIFVLQIDFGANLPLIILVTLVGGLAGLALGVLLASTVRSNANLKVGLILAVTMLGCFFAGMMGPSIKYLIDTHLPLLNRLNPASLITDSFYTLYYYETLDRYWGNIITLVIITLVIIVLSVRSLRKEQYDRL